MDLQGSNPYLEQEVLTASPIKLRWLLINKALQLTRIVQQLWSEKQFERSLEWHVWLRDVLNELLAGIHGTDELAKKVSDLYVFMLKLLTEAELKQEVKPLADLQQLLEIESETWLMLLQESTGAKSGAAASTAVSTSAATMVAPSVIAPTFSLSSDGESSLCIDA